jgi:biotin carboxylase
MDTLKGKKLLILGGANQHLKFVEAAKEMGVYTIVTDYLADSPCKRICDEPLMLNITDVEHIVSYCKENHVDGVVAGFLDPCQLPYAKVCSELGLPCYGSPEQFFKFTNKIAFKALCKKNGVRVIPDYTEADFRANRIVYPVFVKPVDSRGSRGQTVCHKPEEMEEAIRFAKDQSSNGDILIEQYMGDCDEVQITNFVIEGKVYLERTVDSYRGDEQKKLQKVVSCSISPSRYTDEYLNNCHESVCKMILDLGIQNGPIFMQGFYKEGNFYFFDPGLRFPGVEFERIYKEIWGVDFAKLLIQFALTGHFPVDTVLPVDGAKLNNKVGAVLFPVLRGGRVCRLNGLQEFCEDSRVVSCMTRYKEGDEVGWTYDVNQRFAEIDILGSSITDIADTIRFFYDKVSVLDDEGHSLFFDPFDTHQLYGFNNA